MKILIFNNQMQAGGTDRVTANLANYWCERGWQVTVATVTPPELDFYHLSPSIERIAFDRTARRVDGSSRTGMLRRLSGYRATWNRVRALRSALRRLQPDAALAIDTWPGILLALAAIGPGRSPVLIGSEHTHPPAIVRKTQDRLRRLLYPRLAAVVALTEKSADWLRSNTRAANVVVIPNAVQWPAQHGPPVVNPDSVGIAGRRRLLAVGRLVSQKGFDFLIQAFAQIAERFPDWDLVIAGEGPMEAALRAQAEAGGIGGRVAFPGIVGNVGDWYESADAFVLSSMHEGFAMVLIEAMAYGLPVVSFDCDTGPRDIIRHEIDGLLVPPEDAGALATAMARLMADPALRQRLAERAVEVRDRFSVARIGKMWDDLFASLGLRIAEMPAEASRHGAVDPPFRSGGNPDGEV